MKKLFLFLILLALGSTFAQTNELKFTKQEVFSDYKIVNFVLDKPITYDYLKEIMIEMINDNVIQDMWLDGETSCRAKVSLNTKPEIIQSYLKKYGYNYAFDVVIKENSYNNNIMNNNLPTHYPEKINTGNPKQDEKNFLEAYSKWRINYPEEWENYKNTIK